MATALGWRTIPIELLGRPSGPARVPRLDAEIDPLESARVQALRGIACLLLVAFHAIGATAASGLHVPDDSPWRTFTNLVVHLRMPLFTFLSGFVYALRPIRPGQVWNFSGKKLRRLGVPLIVASTVLYGLHTAMHHPVPPPSHLWTIYLFPYWHLWFVQALLVVFALLVVLESIGALSTFTRFAVVLALAVALYFAAPFQARNVFSVYSATYLLPFFLCGVGAHRFRGLVQTRRALMTTVLCLALAQGVHSYVVLTRTLAPIEPVDQRSALNLVIGVAAGLCALQLLPRMRAMERIGGSSYTIYLYHPVFIAAVLFAAGVHATAARGLTFMLAAMAGIAGPMVMVVLAGHIPWARLLLEGRTADGRLYSGTLRVVGEAVPAALRRAGRSSPRRV
jgi:peptidoglycan/LPS O-acetylase OafA/YrhL